MVSRNHLKRFWGKLLWHLWNGRARHPGPSLNNLDIEVFSIGGFVTHGDCALDTDAGFLAVVDHWFVLARARSEGARLSRAGHQSIGMLGWVWSASGVPLPTLATAAFCSLVAQGRAKG